MINDGRGPNANQGQATEGTGNQASQEARGDVLVHGLWETGSGCVLDICISDTDARSYADKTSKRVLEDHAKRKKSKYLQQWLDRRRSFAPLVYSVDNVLVCGVVGHPRHHPLPHARAPRHTVFERRILIAILPQTYPTSLM